MAATLCISAATSSAASAATGSYTLTTFSTPRLYNEDILNDGQTISPPAGIPSTATITGISISLQWNTANPSGLNYFAELCPTSQDTGCATVNPPYNGQYGWTTTTNGLNGLNASTQTYHLAASLGQDYSAPTKPALNPVRYVVSKSITVSYTY